MLEIPRWRYVLSVVVCLWGIVYSLPSFLPSAWREQLPSFMPRDTINLGLDLQGGASLLLEVDLQAVIHDELDRLTQGVRKILRHEKLRYTGNFSRHGRVVEFTLKDPFEREKAFKALSELTGNTDGAGQRVRIETDDEGKIHLELTEAALKEREDAAMARSLQIVRMRIDETGVREPSIQRQGVNRILVQLPGIDNPARIRDLIGTTAKLEFRVVHSMGFVQDPSEVSVPVTAELVPTDPVRSDHQGFYILERNAMVSGEHLRDAQATFSRDSGFPVIAFELDPVGAKEFGELTKKYVKRGLAIVLDGKIIDAPTIDEEIPSGQGIVRGRFAMERATDLALMLRSGALPAPMEVVEERSVGPDLGADSIYQGEMATIVSTIAVFIFMFLAYKLWFGGVANIALVFNFVLLIASMTLLGATLTLPGIAGIALTFGMAVDANVLIYERIKEEIRLGNSVMAAIQLGYEKAFATIVDSNVTTLIGSGLLYHFGTGPVRGFAVSLSLGIVISMFTAVTLSRLVIFHWARRKMPTSLSIAKAKV